MTKLKTLKDIELHGAYGIDIRDLKQEAINWVKKEGMIITADEWNEFFNITEEDLSQGMTQEVPK